MHATVLVIALLLSPVAFAGEPSGAGDGKAGTAAATETLPILAGERIGEAEYANAVSLVRAAAMQEAHIAVSSDAALRDPAYLAVVKRLALAEVARFRAERRVAIELGFQAPDFAALQARFAAAAGKPSERASALDAGPERMRWEMFFRQERSRLAVACRQKIADGLAARPAEELEREYLRQPGRWQPPDIQKLVVTPIETGGKASAQRAKEYVLGGARGEPGQRLPAGLVAVGASLKRGERSAPVRTASGTFIIECLSREPAPIRRFAEVKNLYLAERAQREFQSRLQQAVASLSITP